MLTKFFGLFNPIYYCMQRKNVCKPRRNKFQASLTFTGHIGTAILNFLNLMPDS